MYNTGMRAKKKKAKMGRPPKPASEKQSARVMARFTPAEYARLAVDAKKAGMPIATYLVHCWKNRRARHGRSKK